MLISELFFFTLWLAFVLSFQSSIIFSPCLTCLFFVLLTTDVPPSPSPSFQMRACGRHLPVVLIFVFPVIIWEISSRVVSDRLDVTFLFLSKISYSIEDVGNNYTLFANSDLKNLPI